MDNEILDNPIDENMSFPFYKKGKKISIVGTALFLAMIAIIIAVLDRPANDLIHFLIGLSFLGSLIFSSIGFFYLIKSFVKSEQCGVSRLIFLILDILIIGIFLSAFIVTIFDLLKFIN